MLPDGGREDALRPRLNLGTWVGTERLVLPAARCRYLENTRVSRNQQPTLVNAMYRRIQKLVIVAGSALLVAFSACASYRAF